MALILVIDDDAMNRRLAAAALSAAGHEVIEADSGTAGVGLAAARQPALVLLDVNMPPPDGISTLENLRADPRTRDMTVVAFTARAMTGDAELMLKSGFDGYISKPVRYRDLAGRVQEYLDRGAG